MVNIWTYGYYLKKVQANEIRDTLDFIEIAFADIPKITLEKHPNEVKAIIETIEGTAVVGSNVISKFDLGLLSFHELSTGCKTALVILNAGLQDKESFVSITETGPGALKVCLGLLDKYPKVTGVLSAPLDLAGDYEAFQLSINNEPAFNWLKAISECVKEAIVHA